MRRILSDERSLKENNVVNIIKRQLRKESIKDVKNEWSAKRFIIMSHVYLLYRRHAFFARPIYHIRNSRNLF